VLGGQNSAGLLVAVETEKAIRDALEARQDGIRKIATLLVVGTGTVQRVKASLSA
jgi:hypothetical protein